MSSQGPSVNCEHPRLPILLFSVVQRLLFQSCSNWQDFARFRGGDPAQCHLLEEHHCLPAVFPHKPAGRCPPATKVLVQTGVWGLGWDRRKSGSAGTLTMETSVTVGLLCLQALKGHWLGWERKDRCWSELGRPQGPGCVCWPVEPHTRRYGTMHLSTALLHPPPPPRPPFSSSMLSAKPPFYTKESQFHMSDGFVPTSPSI